MAQTSEEMLFDAFEEARAGLLGVEGSSQHMQPMSGHLDREARQVWFITSRKTDLVSAVGQGATAHFTLQNPGDMFYASLKGPIVQVADQAKLDALWSPMSAAWFRQGKEDPDIILLRLDLLEAAMWETTDSTALFGWEMLKANVTGEQPDIGSHTVLNFAKAA